MQAVAEANLPFWLGRKRPSPTILPVKKGSEVGSLAARAAGMPADAARLCGVKCREELRSMDPGCRRDDASRCLLVERRFRRGAAARPRRVDCRRCVAAFSRSRSADGADPSPRRDAGPSGNGVIDASPRSTASCVVCGDGARGGAVVKSGMLRRAAWNRTRGRIDHFGFLRNARTARIRKTMKQPLAIHAAVPAMTPKPRTAAMIAVTRKMMA